MLNMSNECHDTPRPHMVIAMQDEYDIAALAYMPNGRLVTCSCGGSVKVWNVETGEQEGMSMDHGYDSGPEVMHLAVTKDGTKIISGDAGGVFAVWDVESHRLIKEWIRQQIHQEEVDGVSFALSPDDLVAVGWDGVGIYTLEGRLIQSIDVVAARLCFSPDGTKLACSICEEISVYDIKTSTRILGPLHCHQDGITSIVWSHDSTRIFSGSHDDTIRCWNTNTGEQIGPAWTCSTDSLYHLPLSPDGSVLAVTTDSKTICFRDATTGFYIGRPLQHSRRLQSVRFSPCGKFIAAETGGMLYFWRVPWLDTLTNQTNLSRMHVGANTLCIPQNQPLPYGMQTLHSANQEPSLNLCSPTVVSLVDVCLPTDATLYMSGDVPSECLQSILPDPLLGIDNCQRIFEHRLQQLVDLAISRGLRVPQIPFHSLLPQGGLCQSGLGSRADTDETRVSPAHNEPTTSVFRCTSKLDSKKCRKIDRIKEKLVHMLREIEFRLPNDRLPWSTLGTDLHKKGYKILNWPRDVLRERDKGVSGLSVEDADKLYSALFTDQNRLQFVRRIDSHSSSNIGTGCNGRLLTCVSGLNGAREARGSTIDKEPKFRVTTAESFGERPHKRQRAK